MTKIRQKLPGLVKIKGDYWSLKLQNFKALIILRFYFYVN